MEILKNKITHS